VVQFASLPTTGKLYKMPESVIETAAFVIESNAVVGPRKYGNPSIRR
jgi:hypothetical protein